MATRGGGKTALLASTALAVLIAVALWSLTAAPRNELANLAAAVGSSLPLEARLSGGFAPSERHALRGGEASPAGSLSPDARIAIAELEKHSIADPSPRAMAAVGVAHLVAGDVDRAIATLEDAAQMANAAPAWSDLSAAYLVKAQRAQQRRIEYLSRALEAASTSLHVARSDEALFNRALALEGLAPFVGQAAPWAEYISDEHDRAWADVAKRRMASSRTVVDPRVLWEARQKELRAALARHDDVFVNETVKQFPEGATEVFGQLVLAWARALTGTGSPVATGSPIDEATMLATAIEALTGDKMPADEISLVRGGGTVLARAHVAYADGVRLFNSGDYQTAKDALLQARADYARARSSYLGWANAMLANVDFQLRELSSADRQLTSVGAFARERGYVTLLGRSLWLRGLVCSKDWRLTEAFDAFREAASVFERSGAREYAVNIYSLLADALRTLGERSESWENIGKTLEGLEWVRSARSRYLFLYNASLFAASEELLEAALLFQHATVREAAKAAPGVLVDALTQRAVIYGRKGNRLNAERDLNEAEKLLAQVPEGTVKQYHRADMDVVKAQQTLPKSVNDAEAKLNAAIRFFEKAEPARVPRLFLELARIRLRQDSFDSAESALNEGIATLERQQSGLGDEALKISYFDDSWFLFQEMITLQHGVRANSAIAFDYSERARARSLLALAGKPQGPATRNLGDIQAMLPTSVVLAYYATLPDRLLTWIVTPTSSRFLEGRVHEKDLLRLVSAHRAAIAEGRNDDSVNEKLYDFLIRPIGQAPNTTLVFAADGGLQQLPFATIRNPATHRYLIEEHAVQLTPSATFFVNALERLRATPSTLASALLIGNPSSARSPDGAATPSLPGSEAEATEVAKYYQRREVLVGPAATKNRFLRSAQEFDVVHFGGHAIANAEYPLLSRLSLAGEDGAGDRPLFAHEISRLRFTRTRLVILAACSTAVGAVSRGEGAVSVARPFLGAGVPIVVASQWDVDDLATQQLFLEFHRVLSRTQDPVAALRHAQLSLLHSQNPMLARPASWGAFVALGTTAH